MISDESETLFQPAGRLAKAFLTGTFPRGAIRIPLALHAHAALSRYRLFAACAAM